MKSIHSNKTNLVAVAVMGALGVIGVLSYIYIEQRPNPASASEPNVILISIDTLRADHLGVYGYGRDTSPNIDKFASESAVFENAFTPVPCTAPSYTSLFTGLNPSTHNSFRALLDKKYTTLAESFKRKDYKTAGIISNSILENNNGGLARGFNTYNEIDQTDVRDSRENTYGVNGDTTALQKGERTTEEANTWLTKNAKDKFFLFVQYVDPHLPYGQKAPFKDKYVTGDVNNPLSNPDRQQDAYYNDEPTPEETTYLMDKYDENVSYTDYQVGKLLDQIKSQGLYENSLIILTADHGESFDHNTLGHCWRLYDSTVRVPLMIREPGGSQLTKRITDVASLIDIYPTLAAKLGFAPNSYNFDGVDLSPALSGVKIARKSIYAMSNAMSKDTSTADKPKRKILFVGQLYMEITNASRIIYNQNSGKTEYYDITKDPGETTNLFPEVGQNAYERLLLWVNTHPLSDGVIKSNDTRYKTLQGLGYLN